MLWGAIIVWLALQAPLGLLAGRFLNIGRGGD
jgi:hypothetical protein